MADLWAETAAWIQTWLVHGEGDWLGQPFHLTDWQLRQLRKLYRLGLDGRRQYDRALIGIPKGNGKSPLASAIGLAELMGPPAGPSPSIPVAAASFGQARMVFDTARQMVAKGPLSQHAEVWDKAIIPKDRDGEMFRIYSVAGTNDGMRPTFVVGDELHEWVGGKAELWERLLAGVAKRRDAWALGISTAGDNLETLLGGLYRQGRRIEAGVADDDRFLFVWEQASEDWDLDDPEQLRAAIREANPAADLFLDVDRIARFLESGALTEYRFRRLHLNQWTGAPEAWLPAGAWRDLEMAAPPEPGTPVVLGFDGSYNRDATGLVGCTLEESPRVFVLGVWERPMDAPADWRVPRDEVDLTVVRAFDTYRVEELAADPFRWRRELDDWTERWGTPPVIEFPTSSSARMAPACDKFYAAVLHGDLRHDGSPDLARHLANAHTKETARGAYIVKDSKNSPNKIDLAVAAVIAYDRATVRREEEQDHTPMVSLI